MSCLHSMTKLSSSMRNETKMNGMRKSRSSGPQWGDQGIQFMNNTREQIVFKLL